MIGRYFTRIFRKWMGSVCIGCERVHTEETPWCARCAAALPWVDPAEACLRCAVPLADSDPEGGVCARCLADPPPFGRAAAVLWYAPPVDLWVQRLKFSGELMYAAALGWTIAERIAPLGEAVIPVPLSARRQRERGFNQALEIARPVATAWRVPLLATALVRAKSTAMQARLSAAARQRNVAHAFRVVDRQAVAGKRLVLLDDVMTTGATLAAASEALLAAGAAAVAVVAAARAAAVPR